MRNRFQKAGLLAFMPRAWMDMFSAPTIEKPFREENGAAVVSISGPLTNEPDWYWDNYGAIKERVSAALASSASSVILEIDSPGGDVHGMLDCARDMRAMADRARKPMIAFAKGMACSAAYALACSCDRIVAPQASHVGSIGVIDALVDATKQDAMFGLSFAVIASGKRKLDGVPHVEITDEAKADRQRQVMALAGMFFDWVAERRGISADQVRVLEAGVFNGDEAKPLGLVDDVQRLSELLGSLSGSTTKTPRLAARAKGNAMKAMNYAEILAELARLSGGDDEDAQKAKDALNKLNAPEPTPEDQKDQEDQKDAKAAILRFTGLASVAQATKEIERWQASHLALGKIQEENAKKQRATEAETRRQLVAKLVGCGGATPATAWTENADGVPDGKTPAEPWASMTIEALEQFVKKSETGPRKVQAGGGAKPPQTQTSIAGGRTMTATVRGKPVQVHVTEVEAEQCQARGVDLQKFAQRKAERGKTIENESTTDGG